MGITKYALTQSVFHALTGEQTYALYMLLQQLCLAQRSIQGLHNRTSGSSGINFLLTGFESLIFDDVPYCAAACQL
jgi:hypothetical protein